MTDPKKNPSSDGSFLKAFSRYYTNEMENGGATVSPHDAGSSASKGWLASMVEKTQSSQFFQRFGSPSMAAAETIGHDDAHGKPAVASSSAPGDRAASFVGKAVAAINGLYAAETDGRLAKDCYSDTGAGKIDGYSRLGASELEKMGLSPEAFHDQKTGLRAALYKSDDGSSYKLAFRGSEKPGDWTGANIPQAAGLDSGHYDSAVALGKTVKAALPADSLSVVGHSLGGGLAIVTSSAIGTPCTAFNPAWPSAATMHRFGISEQAIENNDSLNIYTVKGEPLQVVQGVYKETLVLLPLESRTREIPGGALALDASAITSACGTDPDMTKDAAGLIKGGAAILEHELRLHDMSSVLNGFESLRQALATTQPPAALLDAVAKAGITHADGVDTRQGVFIYQGASSADPAAKLARVDPETWDAHGQSARALLDSVNLGLGRTQPGNEHKQEPLVSHARPPSL